MWALYIAYIYIAMGEDCGDLPSEMTFREIRYRADCTFLITRL